MFMLKENLDDTLNKYKEHFVGKGFKQVAGYDFHETFSLTIKQTTIWVVFTLALSNSWHVRQLDVNNALLNGDLKDEVYLEQPGGFADHLVSKLVCQLHKSIYELKQVPRA